MSGNKGASQNMTHFIKQILEVLFALLAKSVLHFLGAACVSLRTYTKMVTCKTNKNKLDKCFCVHTKTDTYNTRS